MAAPRPRTDERRLRTPSRPFPPLRSLDPRRLDVGN
jgi:hypothetical protein